MYIRIVYILCSKLHDDKNNMREDGVIHRTSDKEIITDISFYILL